MSRRGSEILFESGRLIGLAILVAFILRSCIPEPVPAAEVEGFAAYNHVSDLFKGQPFNDRPERQLDYVGGGVTITAGKHQAWEIDLSHGIKRTCSPCLVDQGTELSIRFYPGRLR